MDARTFSMKAGDNEQRDLAAGEHFGRLIYYWFIGRELNRYVTLHVFDIIHFKAFCELRLGMLGWVLLNLTFCVYQYKVYGSLSDNTMLITFSLGLLVFNALYINRPF